MFRLSGGNHILREEQTVYQFQFGVDWIRLQFAIGEIQGHVATLKIGICFISLAIQFLSHFIRRQDGSQDFGSVMSPDKLVLASTTAWNLEITSAHWDMYCIIRHFPSCHLGTFIISALMV